MNPQTLLDYLKKTCTQARTFFDVLIEIINFNGISRSKLFQRSSIPPDPENRNQSISRATWYTMLDQHKFPDKWTLEHTYEFIRAMREDKEIAITEEQEAELFLAYHCRDFH